MPPAIASNSHKLRGYEGDDPTVIGRKAEIIRRKMEVEWPAKLAELERQADMLCERWIMAHAYHSHDRDWIAERRLEWWTVENDCRDIRDLLEPSEAVDAVRKVGNLCARRISDAMKDRVLRVSAGMPEANGVRVQLWEWRKTLRVPSKRVASSSRRHHG